MYIVEGNIGAGKSTFLRLISQKIPALKIVVEPVDSWEKHVYGQSLLTHFYEQPTRWAYTFETLTAISRAQQYQLMHLEPLAILERSMYAGFYCFAFNSYQQGFLQEIEWKLYQQWFAFLSQQCKLPTGIIYLRIDPEISFMRIQKRNRYAERNISKAYLRQLHDRYERWLVHNEYPELACVPVHIVDVNRDFEADAVQLHKLIHRLKHFLDATGKAEVPKHGHQVAP